LKRFLAPDLVLILGIWLSFRQHKEGLRPRPPVNLLDVSVLIEHFAAATAAHCAGRREAGVMTEPLADDNRVRIRIVPIRIPGGGRSHPSSAFLRRDAIRHRLCRTLVQAYSVRLSMCAYRGARIMTTWRPSKRASCSTLAKSDVSSLTRLSSL
jgi:hypothetical protein